MKDSLADVIVLINGCAIFTLDDAVVEEVQFGTSCCSVGKISVEGITE